MYPYAQEPGQIHGSNLFDWQEQGIFAAQSDNLTDDIHPKRPDLLPDIHYLLSDAYPSEEQVDVLFEAVRGNLPFGVSFSERLPDPDKARVKGFLFRYCGELQEFMEDSPTGAVTVTFGTGRDIFQKIYGEISDDLPQKDYMKLRGKTASLRGVYSKYDQNVFINTINEHMAEDKSLFETIAHELTHHKDNLEGKLESRPRLTRAARAAGGLAVIGMGVALGGNTSLGPDINGIDITDPVIMFGAWKTRKVGADTASRLEYLLRPKEIRARRAAKHAVAALS